MGRLVWLEGSVSPGGGAARCLIDDVKGAGVEDVAVAEKPLGEVVAPGHRDAVRLGLDDNVGGVDGDDEPFNVDGEPASGGEEFGGAFCFVAGIAEVRDPCAVNHKGVSTDPDVGLGVVLGVDLRVSRGSG